MKTKTKRNLLAALIVPTILYLAWSLADGSINILKRQTPLLELGVLAALFSIQFIILDFDQAKHE